MNIEYRPRDNGDFDEIVITENEMMVHFEMMHEKSLYIGTYQGHHMLQVWIGVDKDGNLVISHAEDNTPPPQALS